MVTRKFFYFPIDKMTWFFIFLSFIIFIGLQNPNGYFLTSLAFSHLLTILPNLIFLILVHRYIGNSLALENSLILRSSHKKFVFHQAGTLFFLSLFYLGGIYLEAFLVFQLEAGTRNLSLIFLAVNTLVLLGEVALLYLRYFKPYPYLLFVALTINFTFHYFVVPKTIGKIYLTHFGG